MSEILLIQTSDSHFHENIRNLRNSYIHEGYDAHNMELCQALMEALGSSGLTKLENCHLIVGGDLTSTGIGLQFNTASTYFVAHHVCGNGKFGARVGLEFNRNRYWTVPGNHDHWNGHWDPFLQPGYFAGIFPGHFQTHPWTMPIQSGELELVLCGIDSNSMYENFWINITRGAAGGFSIRERDGFHQQVQAAMNAPLPDGIKRRTAVVLCHHPFSTDCVAQPLRLPCARWLKELAGELNIPAVFTGHTHRWWTDKYPVKTSRGLRYVWEMRAPTTLQTERKFDKSAKRDPALRRPGFWLHRLTLQSDLTVKWTGKLYLFSSGRFVWDPRLDWFAFTF